MTETKPERCGKWTSEGPCAWPPGHEGSCGQCGQELSQPVASAAPKPPSMVAAPASAPQINYCGVCGIPRHIHDHPTFVGDHQFLSVGAGVEQEATPIKEVPHGRDIRPDTKPAVTGAAHPVKHAEQEAPTRAGPLSLRALMQENLELVREIEKLKAALEEQRGRN